MTRLPPIFARYRFGIRKGRQPGVRVWVRPHKRGNADLGQVTRIVR